MSGANNLPNKSVFRFVCVSICALGLTLACGPAPLPGESRHEELPMVFGKADAVSEKTVTLAAGETKTFQVRTTPQTVLVIKAHASERGVTLRPGGLHTFREVPISQAGPGWELSYLDLVEMRHQADQASSAYQSNLRSCNLDGLGNGPTCGPLTDDGDHCYRKRCIAHEPQILFELKNESGQVAQVTYWGESYLAEGQKCRLGDNTECAPSLDCMRPADTDGPAFGHCVRSCNPSDENHCRDDRVKRFAYFVAGSNLNDVVQDRPQELKTRYACMPARVLDDSMDAISHVCAPWGTNQITITWHPEPGVPGSQIHTTSHTHTLQVEVQASLKIKNPGLSDYLDDPNPLIVLNAFRLREKEHISPTEWTYECEHETDAMEITRLFPACAQVRESSFKVGPLGWEELAIQVDLYSQIPFYPDSPIASTSQINVTNWFWEDQKSCIIVAPDQIELHDSDYDVELRVCMVSKKTGDYR